MRSSLLAAAVPPGGKTKSHEEGGDLASFACGAAAV